jgi:hypothetical protein
VHGFVADYDPRREGAGGRAVQVRCLARECIWDAEMAWWDTYVQVEDGFRCARDSDD